MLKVFNPTGSDLKQNRSVFYGNTTGIINLNNVRYQWAVDLWRQMRENFWIAEKIDISLDVTDYKNLTPSEQRAFDGILAYLVFLDSVQVQNIPHLVRPCSAPEISICFSEQLSQECFDSETELLTSKGWKNVAEINVEDMLAQYNLETTEVTFTNPQKVINYPYEGNMISFDSKNTNIFVTPNHDLIKIHPSTKKVSKEKAEKIIGGNYLYPKTGIFKGDNSYTFTPMDKLLIAIAADGHIRIMKQGNRHVQVSLTKTRKQLKIEDLLEILEIPFTKSLIKDRSNSRFRYSFNIPKEYNGIEVTNETIKSYEFIPSLDKIDNITAQEMIEDICFWDGNTTKTTNYIFYSTNKKAIDIVQIIAMIAGYSAQVGINRTKEQALQQQMPFSLGCPKTAKDCFLVSISKKFKTKTYPNPEEKHYSGNVYCVTVPENNIISRRNGIVAITGNSLHSQSYQYMIETIIPTEKRESIYSYWKDDSILFQRCKIIGNYYQQYIDNPNRENHLKALIADYILEGLYFYVGFTFFYNLASRSLMCGSADIFKMINRDELSHVRLYQKLITDQLENAGIVLKGLGEVFAREMMIEAVNQEINWSLHIIGDDILGMPPKAVEDYVKYLANIRLRAIGLSEIYPDTRNPFKHLEKIADTSKQATTKVNFFDSTVTSYQMSTAVDGWDNF